MTPPPNPLPPVAHKDAPGSSKTASDPPDDEDGQEPSLVWSKTHITNAQEKYSWPKKGVFSLRPWPDDLLDGLLRVPDSRKGEKALKSGEETAAYKQMRDAYNKAVSNEALLRFGSYRCDLCIRRQSKTSLCRYGCISQGDEVLGACAECASRGTAGRCDLSRPAATAESAMVLGGSLRELTGQLYSLELMAQSHVDAGAPLSASVVQRMAAAMLAKARSITGEHSSTVADMDQPELLTTPRRKKSRRNDPSPQL